MNTTSPHLAPRRIQVAFTLLELLVVIAIIGILAGLLLPVLARAKDKARQTQCGNNLHQLGIAFSLYHQDFADLFPAPGSKSVYGPQPEDWIWWQYGRGVEHSSILPFVGNFNAALFTCPGDKDALKLQGQGDLGGDPYRYSFSLTSYSLSNDVFNPGMSTIITPDRKVFPFRSADIKNASAKIMLVEEDRDTIDDSRWIPESSGNQNLVSPRHNGGKGNVIFADGHLQAVTPEFGQDPTNSYPTL
jgi:prepilin-type N-terminal cleavage/methylation domain-containing protein/prepilin-type processing-associated H-X9-DG protein